MAWRLPFDHNPVQYARQCECATLVLHGENDRVAKLAEGQAVCDSLPGQRRLEFFPRAGHPSLHAADRLRWRAAMRTFLDDVARQTINGN